jgi:hypothetical protein
MFQLMNRVDPAIDRSRRPGLRESFRFPVSTAAARHDLLVGGTVLLCPPIGWVLNMGHRLDVVYRVYHDDRPYYRGFTPWPHTFLRGLKAATAILTYLSPALLFGLLAGLSSNLGWLIPSGIFFVLAIYILPGGMTYNAALNDISYLYRPDRALLRAVEGGAAYLHAWLISLTAIALSFLGILGLGIGFFYTSVWAWMVVGYAFSRALSLSREVGA